MHDTQQSTGFDALDKATAAAAIAISVAMRVPAPLKPIADQVIRSASSVPANIAEGAGRSGRDRLHHWRIAYGSAKEVDIHLRLLIATGAVSSTRTADSNLALEPKEYASIGVPGLTMCRNDLPAARHLPHIVRPGSHGKRAPGRLFRLGRRWDAEGGPEGRG